MKFLVVCVAVILAVKDCNGLWWSSDTIPYDANVNVCRGNTLVLLWSFHLESQESVVDIKWHFNPGDWSGSQKLVAMDTEGQFLATRDFVGRVQLVANAGLSVYHVTSENSGTYTVTVTTKRNSYIDVSERRAHVVVAEPPVASFGRLDVTEGVEGPVYSNQTEELHIQLTCGTFVQHGTAPVEVEWLTPGGVVNATLSSGGDFLLVLDNPVVGGNYTCRLSPHSPPAVCLTPGDPLLEGDSVYVDETEARLTLLEALQAKLLSENNKLKSDNSRLETELLGEKQHVDVLETDLVHQQQHVDVLEREVQEGKQQINTLEQKLADVTKLLEQMLHGTVATTSSFTYPWRPREETTDSEIVTTRPAYPWWRSYEETTESETSSTRSAYPWWTSSTRLAYPWWRSYEETTESEASSTRSAYPWWTSSTRPAYPWWRSHEETTESETSSTRPTYEERTYDETTPGTKRWEDSTSYSWWGR